MVTNRNGRRPGEVVTTKDALIPMNRELKKLDERVTNLEECCDKLDEELVTECIIVDDIHVNGKTYTGDIESEGTHCACCFVGNCAIVTDAEICNVTSENICAECAHFTTATIDNLNFTCTEVDNLKINCHLQVYGTSCFECKIDGSITNADVAETISTCPIIHCREGGEGAGDYICVQVGDKCSEEMQLVCAACSYTSDYSTTATNLASNPQLSVGSVCADNITVTAGNKTSQEFTVPYATKATNATNAVTATNLENAPVLTQCNTCILVTAGGKDSNCLEPKYAKCSCGTLIICGAANGAFPLLMDSQTGNSSGYRSLYKDCGNNLTFNPSTDELSVPKVSATCCVNTECLCATCKVDTNVVNATNVNATTICATNNVNIDGNTVIGGNLTVNGTMSTIHAQDVSTCQDVITLRECATSAIGGNCYSGFKVTKYDGNCDLIVGVDNEGTLKVGTNSSNMEAFATRDEAACMENNYAAHWDSTDKLIKTNGTTCTHDLCINGNATATGAITANSFTGDLTGNADTATKLAATKNINGTAFDGSADITTTKWGTARDVSISDSDGTNTSSAVSVDGSANATLKLPPTIKATLTGNADTSCCVCTSATTNNGTCYVTLSANNTTGKKQIYTNANLTYNPSTGTLTATKFCGQLAGCADDSGCFAGKNETCWCNIIKSTCVNNAAYATSAGTAASATKADNVCMEPLSSNGTYYVTFSSTNTAGYKRPYTNACLSYNPAIETLSTKIAQYDWHETTCTSRPTTLNDAFTCRGCAGSVRERLIQVSGSISTSNGNPGYNGWVKDYGWDSGTLLPHTQIMIPGPDQFGCNLKIRGYKGDGTWVGWCDLGCFVGTVSCAVNATNATCFNGCTYAQACANIRSGLTSCIGTVTSVNVSVNGVSGTAVTSSGTVTLTGVKGAGTCVTNAYCLTTFTGSGDRPLVLADPAPDNTFYTSSLGVTTCTCPQLTYNPATGVLKTGAVYSTAFQNTSVTLGYTPANTNPVWINVGYIKPDNYVNSSQSLELHVGGVGIVDTATIDIHLATAAGPTWTIRHPTRYTGSAGLTCLCLTKSGNTWCDNVTLWAQVNPFQANTAFTVNLYKKNVSQWVDVMSVASGNPTGTGILSSSIGNNINVFTGTVYASCFCGNLCGTATCAVGICRVTRNDNGTCHLALLSGCTAISGSAIVVSNGCPLTYNPATGVLTAKCFCGCVTATGTIENATCFNGCTYACAKADFRNYTPSLSTDAYYLKNGSCCAWLNSSGNFVTCGLYTDRLYTPAYSFFAMANNSCYMMSISDNYTSYGYAACSLKDSVAIGPNSYANKYAVAIGSGIKACCENSVAINGCANVIGSVAIQGYTYSCGCAHIDSNIGCSYVVSWDSSAKRCDVAKLLKNIFCGSIYTGPTYVTVNGISKYSNNLGAYVGPVRMCIDCPNNLSCIALSVYPVWNSAAFIEYTAETFKTTDTTTVTAPATISFVRQ